MTNFRLGFKQAGAFGIDMIILILFSTLISAAINIFLMEKSYLIMYFIFISFWLTYIPFCEFKYGQTIGMKIFKTKIFFKDDLVEKLDAISARQIARVSMVWGVLGWFMFSLGKQVRLCYHIKELPLNQSVEKIEEVSGYTNILFYILILISFGMGYFTVQDTFSGY